MGRSLRPGPRRCKNCDRVYDGAYEGGYKFCGTCHELAVELGYNMRWGSACRIPVREERVCACGCGAAFRCLPTSRQRFASSACVQKARRTATIACSECGVGWQAKPIHRDKGETRCGLCRQAAHNDEQRRLREARRATPKPATSERRTSRASVLERLVRCEDCGRTQAEVGETFHLHHATPRALGGTNDPDNLRLLCPDCHLGKGWERHHPGLVKTA